VRGLLDQDQKIASKLAPTRPLESITYFMFDKSCRPVYDAALSRSKQDSEYLQLPPIGSLCSGLMKPDTHLGENARPKEVSDDQATPYLYP
jgi:hypothetical protein